MYFSYIMLSCDLLAVNLVSDWIILLCFLIGNSKEGD
jgi:hypothetical protein